jgi:hypothetical protein
MNQKKPAVLFVLLFLLSFAVAFAQAAEPRPAASPESVVKSYLEALKSGEYLAVAEMMHPEALEKFRGMLLPIAEEAAGANKEESFLVLFRGVADVAALKKLSPAEFFAAFFGGVTDANPVLKDALASGSMNPIGSVPEGDMLHMVCRTSVSVEGLSLTKMEVISLRQSQGNWRVLLSGEMEGIAQALRKAAGKN